MSVIARTALVWIWTFLVPLAAVAQTTVSPPNAPSSRLLGFGALGITLVAVVLWMFAVRYRNRVHP